MKSVFDRDEYKQYREAWETRLKELNLRASYYDGSVYRGTREGIIWSMGPRVAKEIKPLFLPLSRAVDIDAGLVPAGWEFDQEDSRYQTWAMARDALFDASKWDINGVLFVHFGAMYGVTGLRVSDVWEGNKRVMVIPANPTNFMIIPGQYGDPPVLAFWVEERTEAGKGYEYAEVITPAEIMTFRNGVPFAFDGRESVFKNTQGAIPIFEATHLNDGTPLGECTYQKAIPMLDEVNTMATRLSTVIARNVDPQWVTSGAEPTDLKRGSDYMWFLPEGADVKAAAPTIDIPGVLEFIREIRDGVKESLPELSFDDIKKAGQIATQTIELQLVDLVIKIKRVRPNYDRALTEAMKAAGRIAAQMGMSDLAVLDDPELILDTNREILPLSPQDRISLEMMQIELEQMKAGSNVVEGVNA